VSSGPKDRGDHSSDDGSDGSEREPGGEAEGRRDDKGLFPHLERELGVASDAEERAARLPGLVEHANRLEAAVSAADEIAGESEDPPGIQRIKRWNSAEASWNLSAVNLALGRYREAGR
jgi:hypothetical protein